MAPRRQRRNYAQVSTAEGGAAGSEQEGSFVNDSNSSAVEATGITTATPSGRGQRSNNNRSYNRVAAGDEEHGLTSSDDSSTATNKTPSLLDAADSEEEEDLITVVILDVAQKKFKVTVSLSATVETFKLAGSKVHKVSPDRQRLIYRGKLLQDQNTLQESGIADETIVHLFPKPRVVIKETNSNNNTEESKENETTDEEEGARVPTIVLDADEAERRSQILVLGSQDYLEAQNNVKLFSFMLLIISSIELMNLMFLAAGVPQEEQGNPSNSNNGGFVTLDDDIFPHGGSNNNSNDDAWSSNTTTNSGGSGGMELVVEPWKPRYTFDFIISVMGVYVGILGLQASTHNTLYLAKWYLWGTAVTGVGWMIYNFIETYRIDQEVEAQHESDPHYTDILYDDDDLFWQAVTVMVLPGMVWLMCTLRAFQFQHLLLEAEMEAQTRIRSEFDTVQRAAAGETAAVVVVDTTTTTTAVPNHDEELVLQRPSARIS